MVILGEGRGWVPTWDPQQDVHNTSIGDGMMHLGSNHVACLPNRLMAFSDVINM